MSTTSVSSPYPIFSNSDGLPLSDGYIYIGEVNLNPEAYPKTAWWDEALTIAAAQPIRTINGYPSRNGSPARIYVDENYSIVVKNKIKSTVYSSLSTTDLFSLSNYSFETGKVVGSVTDFIGLTSLTNGNAIFVTDSNHGGEFVYDTSILKTAHNGGTIFDPDIDMTTWTYTSANAGFGVLRRLYDGAVNVKWFGSVGDWDGISGADNTAAFQAVMDFVAPTNSSVFVANPNAVDIGLGNYKITSTVRVPRGIRVFGINGKTSLNSAISMISVTNIPIFDLLGYVLPNGTTRVADQTVTGIHFNNPTGHAIRAVEADYPLESVSFGSISISKNHLLNCNGDNAINVDYLELVFGNTFDYAQIGHINTKNVESCFGNMFYRGVGGSIKITCNGTQSLITGNKFYESGTASGDKQAAISIESSVAGSIVSLSGNNFFGSGTGGIYAVDVSGTVLDSLLFNDNTIKGTVATIRSTSSDLKAFIFNDNLISGTTGTTTSNYNVDLTSVGSIDSTGSIFDGTANLRDISIATALGGVVRLTTSKVSLPTTVRKIIDSTTEATDTNDKVKKLITTGTGEIQAQSWLQNTSTFALMTTNAETAVGWSTSQSVFKLGKTSNGRSLNAGGTLNASGADYAEYVYKRDDCGIIEKGQIVGIDENGLITDKFSLSKQFMIKTTNPSYVGGDTWFTEQLSEDASEAEIETYFARMELERKKVDRLAFSGIAPIIDYGIILIPGKFLDAIVSTGDVISIKMSDIASSSTVGRIWAINKIKV